jgi:hypothetical protein
MYCTYKTVNTSINYVDNRRTMTATNYRPVLSSERAPHIDKPVTVQEYLICGHEPQTGLDTKTD